MMKKILAVSCFIVLVFPVFCRCESETDAAAQIMSENREINIGNLKKWKKYYQEKSHLYFSENEYEKSAGIDEHLLKLKLSKKELKNIYCRLGKSFLELGRYEKAIKYFKEAIKLRKNDTEILFDLAKSYESVDLNDEALKYYRRCTQLDGSFWQAYLGMGRIYWKKGLMDKSIAELRLGIALNDKNAEQFNLASRVLESLNDLKGAVEMQEKSMTIDEKPEYYTRMGYLNFQLKNYDKALYYFKFSSNLQPLDSEPVLYMGVSYLKKGEKYDAEKCLTKVVSMDETNSLAYFFLAIVSEQEEEFKKAREYIDLSEKYGQSKELLNYTGYLKRKMEIGGKQLLR